MQLFKGILWVNLNSGEGNFEAFRTPKEKTSKRRSS